MGLDAIIAQCAINTHPETVKAIIRVESNGNPLAIGVNHGGGRAQRPRTPAEAAQIASELMASGKNIDMGLMQINSANMRRLGLTTEVIFDPCTNIRVGTQILSTNYAQAVQLHGEGEVALRAALSAYNTGSMVRGLRNGYVARYYHGNNAARFTSVQEARINEASSSLSSPPPENLNEILVEELDPFTAGSAVYSRE
jgi:type IV secretion system protein VirB1